MTADDTKWEDLISLFQDYENKSIFTKNVLSVGGLEYLGRKKPLRLNYNF